MASDDCAMVAGVQGNKHLRGFIGFFWLSQEGDKQGRGRGRGNHPTARGLYRPGAVNEVIVRGLCEYFQVEGCCPKDPVSANFDPLVETSGEGGIFVAILLSVLGGTERDWEES
jgi:hypothetical protein